MTTTTASRAWHAETPDDAIHQLSGSPDGLSTDEAARRLARYGPNDLTRQRSPSGWTVLLRQFTSPLIYALLASAGVAYAFGETANGSVVLSVVVLNAAIGFGSGVPRRPGHPGTRGPGIRPRGSAARWTMGPAPRRRTGPRRHPDRRSR